MGFMVEKGTLGKVYFPSIFVTNCSMFINHPVTAAI
jgi:hypothetical protein